MSEDLADDAIGWLQRHKAFQRDKPFFMYWASGAIHGPFHIMKEWADKYKGKFDDGWDVIVSALSQARRRKVDSARRPTYSAPRNDAVLGQHPRGRKTFQRRLMELGAGFTEHVDVQVGRIVDEIDKLGYGDNTLIFYIWGDNGSSSEGQGGTISELLAQNGIPTTVKQHIEALEELGGWMCSAHQRPILSTMRMGGPAARRIRAQSCWPRISAALVTRWPSDGRQRSNPTRRRGRSFIT